MKINEIDPFAGGKDRNVAAHNRPEQDYSLEDIQKDIKQNYSIFKTYRARRLEPGFRAVKTIIGADFGLHHDIVQKSADQYQNFDDMTDLLNFTVDNDMSGSEQPTPSIGYSWYTLFNSNRSAGIVYYEDRGMGWDEINLFANDKEIFFLIRKALGSYGFIPTPKPKVKK